MDTKRPPSHGVHGPSFNRLWAGVAVSNVGDGIRLVALPLLAATITHDPGLVAGLMVALRLPWLLFSIPAGALIDRLDRRRLMAQAGVFRAASIGLLGGFVVGGNASISVLYVVAFLVGVGEVVFDTSAQVLIPTAVDSRDLERANGRIYATELIGNELAGPPVGSFLFAIAVGAPFLIAALAYGAAALIIRSMPGHYQPLAVEVGSQRRALDGLRYVWSDKLLRSLTLFAVIWNLVVGGVSGVGVLFALDVLNTGEVGFGLLIAAEGAGGLAGTLVASRLSRRFGAGSMILGAAAIQGVGFSVTGLLSNPWLAGLMLALAQASGVACVVVLVSLRQSIVPNQLLGRATAGMRVLAIGAMPFGSLLGGLVASATNLRVPLLTAGPLMLATVALAAKSVNNRTIGEARKAAAV